ncbi:lipid II:glycine glycyltransferase FemX [Entomospira culicis]|uniref:Peptidoglycan bridge formation glycyltransferase FemA/FemB family protein n=1 Tax=Entomospira culicis TaxID=2719989 RepID=A0A968GJK0_9SPIO|nr:peptidoglycan bridge formation glycyltransferase FemA/FemB family protein [Entomospira culicis]NIZ18810.1 peptidoglycan bridge formation glycyltransferase FemA/FemB family protein [Entomospira culicis]NIZ69025.1 peptidoglycan bridge formation glycyltransferase FemA/FemB family protein [Entomospira culicis]WDI37615.1 peptidoglycan bridge formation glycyltransferase FemA/FemB family protein [Entomospira culicis]WDI39243.1 peptidoglycan bridge formation glycyltransferase FemA/FemB family protei
MSQVTLFREPLLASNNFLQTEFWAYFKENFGWQAHTFRLNIEGADPTFILVLTRSLAPTLTLAYVPHPNLNHLDPQAIPSILKQTAKLMKRHIPDLFLVRWDLNLPRTQGAITHFRSYLKDLPSLSIQPADTTILNLQPDLETILEKMHKKTRYNIRLAEKKGVKIVQAPIHDVVKWYDLYKETAKRDGITIHSLAYYQKFFQVSHQHHYYPKAQLLLAYHDDDLLAGIILLFTDTHATYVYGASSNHKRNLMPSYALQWQAIQLAKEKGCTAYDFFGLPPEPNPDHPMFGLYQFKVGFGGDIHHYMSIWDAPTSCLRYRLYRLAEALRALRKHRHKKHLKR